MVDTGYLYFSVINESLVRKYGLYSEKIPPRYLRLADGSKAVEINQITHIKLDFVGRVDQIVGYVMPNLSFPIIFGKPWTEYNNVVYSARRKNLTDRKPKTWDGSLRQRLVQKRRTGKCQNTCCVCE